MLLGAAATYLCVRTPHFTDATAPDAPVALAASTSSFEDDYQQLRRRNLVLPIAGLKSSDLQDTFNSGRPGGRHHEATDILAPRGTPVRAMDDGSIRKLFNSKPGGLTIYEFDREGIYCYYYAHLDGYAPGLKEGMQVQSGEVIGYVGTTGDAPKDTPHLHLTITRIGPDKHWWGGTPIDPYPILKKLRN